MSRMSTVASQAEITGDSLVVDFHLHSNASDGCDPPRRVIQRARDAGLRAVALTDHDTVGGLAEAGEEAARLGIEFIDGIELSATHAGRLVHILGHFIDPGAPELTRRVGRYGRDRAVRMEGMIDRLVGMGVSFDREGFLRRYGGTSSIGRGQLSSYMLETGVVRSRDEAFQRFIGEDGPAYVELPMIAPAEAVRLIVGAGGAATYAHPHLSGADEIIPELIAAGLAGIEVEHPSQDAEVRGRYRALAREYGLLPMGGSDCHGGRLGPVRMGQNKQPYRMLAALRERRAGRG